MEQFVDLVSGTVGLLMWVALYVAFAVSLQTIAKKTGLSNGWFAWVPILNIVLLLQIAGMDLWMIILYLIPCVGWIFNGYVWSKVAQERGKSEFIGWLMLVPIVNIFIPLYIAFSD
jgi:hypothetical protein